MNTAQILTRLANNSPSAALEEYMISDTNKLLNQFDETVKQTSTEISIISDAITKLDLIKPKPAQSLIDQLTQTRENVKSDINALDTSILKSRENFRSVLDEIKTLKQGPNRLRSLEKKLQMFGVSHQKPLEEKERKIHSNLGSLKRDLLASSLDTGTKNQLQNPPSATPAG